MPRSKFEAEAETHAATVADTEVDAEVDVAIEAEAEAGASQGRLVPRAILASPVSRRTVGRGRRKRAVPAGASAASTPAKNVGHDGWLRWMELRGARAERRPGVLRRGFRRGWCSSAPPGRA